jgi:hypothetical protein
LPLIKQNLPPTKFDTKQSQININTSTTKTAGNPMFENQEKWCIFSLDLSLLKLMAKTIM